MACICEGLDLGSVDAVELGWHTEKGCHFVQAWPCGGTEPGKHVAEIDVIATEAIPVIAATAMKQPRNGQAEGKCPVAQNRQVEAAAVEAHEHGAGAAIVSW